MSAHERRTGAGREGRAATTVVLTLPTRAPARVEGSGTLKRREAVHPDGSGGRMANLKRVLWHLLGGTRGGPLRIRIIALLRDRPYNTNQVAEMLRIDYKTAQHHLRVLTENRIVSPTGSGYGAVFLFTRDMEESLAEFDAIAAKVVPRAAVPAEPARREGAS